ncbi:hypothetical protein CBR_g10863 [Chara braunii]|uniref:Reverse transcriptase domain-containing protein n=1 Tax=Chara braunii TaxID=69332 RepID=A0A388KPH0_CHABU|nr:hypothetical protein CBR_g10863 [Chara braunii]|eukprot:GBG71927.1 hypothetical protein CBR_g10863 [Chara braunii]
MTVYLPSEPAAREAFLEELPHLVPQATHVVLAGDFNLVLQPGLDSPMAAPPKTDAQTLQLFMEDNEFIDAYRHTHLQQHGYTWFSSQRTGDTPPPKRRLDLILNKGAAWETLTTADVVIAPGSDHRPVIADFLLDGALQRGPGIFRLNTDHLEVPEVIQWVATHWRDWHCMRDWFTSEAEWTAVGFRVVTRALDNFSRIQTRGRRQQEEECLAKVKEAEEMLETEPLTELYWQHKRDCWLQKWEDLQIEQQVMWANRAKEKGMIVSDRMTKETFQTISPHRSHSTIRELKHPFHEEADTATDSKGIGDFARQYFQDILTSRRPPGQSLHQLQDEHNMWQDTTAKLSHDASYLLEKPITELELWHAVKAMTKGNSPDSDGLPIKFYIATWDHVGPILLNLYNGILDGGTLTNDMKYGVITLLYKKGDKRNLRNWRPISRLNASYKILAQVLASRLAPHLPGLVHTNQGAFVQGRSIFENVLMAMGAFEIIQREDRQVMLAMLDLEKVCDRVNWSFVLATLQHMNFSPKFRQWVKELYTDSTAAVIKLKTWPCSASGSARQLLNPTPESFMESFLRRRPSSPLANACWTAWKALQRMQVKQPVTQEEVLQQILFDNALILDSCGHAFKATRSPHTFGRAWTERGIVRIADVWDESADDWITEELLKTRLRHLPHVPQRRQQIIDAIPSHWVALLRSKDPVPGQWYITTQDGGNEEQIVNISQDLGDGLWLAQQWSKEVFPGKPVSIVNPVEICIDGQRPRHLIRVYDPVQPVQTSRAAPPLLLLEGKPLRCLKMDPLGHSWILPGGQQVFPFQYSLRWGRRIISEAADSSTNAARNLNRLSQAQPPLEPRHMSLLWDQLKALPS